jgi:hypothetical protein
MFLLRNRDMGSSGPNSVLDLANWKLTLPIGQDGSDQPQEIKQPDLRSYRSWFFQLNDMGTGTVFRASVGGVAVVRDGFVRTELREMTYGGTRKAAWSSIGSVNTMTIRESIDHLPPGRPSLVAGQIHGAGNHYVALVRLDGGEMYIKTENGTAGVLDDNYRLGTVFTVKLVSSDGRVYVYYNGALKVTLQDDCSGCYFKAGVYLQSSAKWDNPDAYGQVTIYDIEVTHEAS